MMMFGLLARWFGLVGFGEQHNAMVVIKQNMTDAFMLIVPTFELL